MCVCVCQLLCPTTMCPWESFWKWGTNLLSPRGPPGPYRTKEKPPFSHSQPVMQHLCSHFCLCSRSRLPFTISKQDRDETKHRFAFATSSPSFQDSDPWGSMSCRGWRRPEHQPPFRHRPGVHPIGADILACPPLTRSSFYLQSTGRVTSFLVHHLERSSHH